MSDIRIEPCNLSGDIKIPPSKSMSHRAIICASLSEDETEIKDIIFSKDIIASIEAMRSFGANIKCDKEKGKIIIKGIGTINVINNKINCNESGSTIRFLIPISLTQDKEVTFYGEGKLVERPLQVYYNIFNEKKISYKNEKGKLPLTLKGPLDAGVFKVRGDVSSQFITGLLFALPLLYKDSRIIVTTELESKAYVDLTIDMLKKFGVYIDNKDYKEFYIKGNQRYKSKDYKVEGDFSQGAFFLVAGILGGNITCTNLWEKSLQGDKAILEILKNMGAKIEVTENTVKAFKSKTKGIEIDVSQCPDLVPILSVVAALSNGTTKIIKAKRLRIKECDRLKAMATELKVLGADIEEFSDGLIIKGKESLKGGEVKSWNDHRIAMALAVASIRCSESVVIKDANSVEKSYPDFWKDFSMLGGKIYECHMGE
ncbi:3-phosphoshikimate 1-carboxyvinyltransferase [Haloimpatiens sp. FM7315]|uniref:3-phosphoshikimate 1-carboxyvinyltransferase n=1 Tax=Haloimpatiens sp. FM7315 TaxID=3298609 RepID=UPI00370AEF0E